MFSANYIQQPSTHDGETDSNGCRTGRRGRRQAAPEAHADFNRMNACGDPGSTGSGQAMTVAATPRRRHAASAATEVTPGRRPTIERRPISRVRRTVALLVGDESDVGVAAAALPLDADVARSLTERTGDPKLAVIEALAGGGAGRVVVQRRGGGDREVELLIAAVPRGGCRRPSPSRSAGAR